jgi:hypothetical protein
MRVSFTDLAQRVEEKGFAIVHRCLDEVMVERHCSGLSATTYSARNLLAVPIVRDLASSAPVRALAEAVLGKNCFAVKG